MERMIKLKTLMFKYHIKSLELSRSVNMSPSFLSQCIQGKRPMPAIYKGRIVNCLKNFDPTLNYPKIFEDKKEENG